MSVPGTLPLTLGEALAFAKGRVDAVDARVLLREAAQISAAALVGFPERALPTETAARYAEWIARRERGDPIAYIVGEREFYSRVFKVTPDTLIPRPDTELLVEIALEKLRAMRQRRVLDLGTGTGVIAITLALEMLAADVTAVDASLAALGVARENATHLGAKVRALHGSWLAPVLGERFDLIVSNPPYIVANDPHLAQGDLRFEPHTALAAGSDGLNDIRSIVSAAPQYLSDGGWLLLEHGYDQATRVRELLKSAGFVETQSWRNLAGIERVTGASIG